MSMALNLEDVERINDLIVSPITKQIDALANDLKDVKKIAEHRPCEAHANILESVVEQLKEQKRESKDIREKQMEHEIKIKSLKFKVAFYSGLVGAGIAFVIDWIKGWFLGSRN